MVRKIDKTPIKKVAAKDRKNRILPREAAAGRLVGRSKMLASASGVRTGTAEGTLAAQIQRNGDAVPSETERPPAAARSIREMVVGNDRKFAATIKSLGE